MLLILQIALGIVLAVLILGALPKIVNFGIVAIGIGIALLLLIGIIYFVYLGIESPEFSKILYARETKEIGSFIVLALLLFGMYHMSLSGTWLEKTFPIAMLVLALVAGVIIIAADVERGKLIISSSTFVGTLILGIVMPAILLLLRGFVKFGIPNKLQPLAQKVPPRLMLLLGLKSGSAERLHNGDQYD